MENIFTGSEIVELGIQIEKNGRDFYNTLAADLKIKNMQDVFKYLAGVEERHIEDFKQILKNIENYEPAEAYPGEYFAYMNALAGDYIFTRKNKGAEIAKNIKSGKEAVELGIGFEKDSIVFYEGIKTVVPVYEHKIIGKLIFEEQNHLTKLYDLKNKIQ